MQSSKHRKAMVRDRYALPSASVRVNKPSAGSVAGPKQTGPAQTWAGCGGGAMGRGRGRGGPAAREPAGATSHSRQVWRGMLTTGGPTHGASCSRAPPRPFRFRCRVALCTPRVHSSLYHFQPFNLSSFPSYNIMAEVCQVRWALRPRVPTTYSPPGRFSAPVSLPSPTLATTVSRYT